MILPTPVDVRAAREEIGFTQARAAKWVHVSESTWRKWETNWTSNEYRQIGGAHWELFLIKTKGRRPKTSRFYQTPPTS